MAKSRKIRKVIKSKPTMEGAGVHLKRVFGFGETSDFDPFLLLDDYRSTDPNKFLAGWAETAASRIDWISATIYSARGHP